MKTIKLAIYALSVVLAIWGITSCEKKDPPKSDEKQITAFSINQTDGMIDENAKTIAVTLPFRTNLTALAPTITVSSKATVTPASGAAQDFTVPVTYTVTAEDGTVQDYIVTATVTANSEAKITSFVFSGLTPAVTATINETDKTITAVLPKGTDPTALAPVITVSDSARVTPASGSEQDFSSPVIYKVTAEDGTEATYTANISVTKSSDKQILSFMVNEVSAAIDEAEKKITCTIPYGPNITALSPVITVSDDASVSPASGEAHDFTAPATYTVTAEDGSTVQYTATITIKAFETSITGVSATTLKPGEAMTISGVFAESGNVVELEGNGLTELSITSENANSITAVIPQDIAEGEYALHVTANGTKATYSGKIEVTDPPYIVSLSKTILMKGEDSLIVTGRNLRATNGEGTAFTLVPVDGGGDSFTYVSVNAEGTIVNISKGQINLYSPGKYKLKLHVGWDRTSNEVLLEIIENTAPAPEISSVDNLNPCRGTNVTITGSNFGDDVEVGLYEDGWMPGTTEIVSKTSTQITFKTDYLYKNNYTIKVTGNGKTATYDGGTLKVEKCAPVFSSLNKTEAAAGDEMIIKGDHFIEFPTDVSIIVGGKYTTGKVQDNTTITFTIPAGVTPGETDIVVSDYGKKLTIPITIIEK